MSYLVLARKYRPQKFDDVIGQKHITETIKNALKTGKVSHAYIFNGPRGVGKTSTARILAKALNCADGPTVSPCNKCPSCKAILSGNHIDLFEIDGASNRSIDDVKQLREKVNFVPSMGRYKIYIIDEVHMLTREAFNALLKTLEEPPDHVVFIFATTEIHKVPGTIISRCQRFDFRRLTAKMIVSVLQDIIKKEGFQAEEEALFYIAKYVSGSIRDSESILDQMISYSNGNIKKEDVKQLLGIIDNSKFINITNSFINNDLSAVLGAIKELYIRGVNLSQFVLQYIEFIRKLYLLLNNYNIMDIFEMTATEFEEIHKYSDTIILDDVNDKIKVIADKLRGIYKEVRVSSLSKMVLELGFIDIMRSINNDIAEVKTIKNVEDKDKPSLLNKDINPLIPADDSKMIALLNEINTKFESILNITTNSIPQKKKF